MAPCLNTHACAAGCHVWSLQTVLPKIRESRTCYAGVSTADSRVHSVTSLSLLSATPPPRTSGSQDKMISCKIIPCPPDHRDAQERLRLSKRPADTPPQMALRVLGTQRTVTLPAHGWCQMGNFHFLEGPSGPHPSPISSSVKGKPSPPGNAWEFHIHTMWPCAAHLLCWSRNT